MNRDFRALRELLADLSVASCSFFFSRALTCVTFASRAQGGANTLKAQQIEFQAQKKLSGNTHTARGMPLNLFALAFIGVGGTMMMCNTLRKLYWGVGKIVLKDDE